MALWWQQSGFEWLEDGDSQEPVALDVQPELSQTEALRQAMGDSSDEATLVIADDAETRLSQESEDGDRPLQPVEADTAATEIPASRVEQTGNADSVAEVEVAEAETRVQTARVETGGVETAPVQAAPAGDDELLISTTSESWTEITDANGSRLLFKLMQRGQDYRIQGQAPFNIFLGNAPSVDIRVNDKSVSIADYTRSNNIANVMIYADGRLASSRTLRQVRPAAPAAEDSGNADSSAQPQVDSPADPDSSRDLMFD